jgi:hypothetical protein
MRNWCARNAEHSREYQRQRNRSRRETVLEHYGGCCGCCGEETFEFLAVDHENGGGTAHRAEVGAGTKMIDWIIANEYPDGFRVLCHNCNQAIGYYGRCPHE